MVCTLLVVLILAYSIIYKGGNELKNDFIESIEIGHTTLDEVLAMDSKAQTACVAYGCWSFHVLEDGTKVKILFAYDNNRKDFFASSIDIISSASGDSTSVSD